MDEMTYSTKSTPPFLLSCRHQPRRSAVSKFLCDVPGRAQGILGRRSKHKQSRRGVDDESNGEPALRSSVLLPSPDRRSYFCNQEHATVPETVPLEPWHSIISRRLQNVPRKAKGALRRCSRKTGSRRGVGDGCNGD
ncbi:hypothetical protein MRX96_058348 [Rhipicephalus microplus]